MRKVTLLFLILTVIALVNSRIVRRKKLSAKRQIFDTLDYNKDYKEKLSPNQIILKGYNKPATYLPPKEFEPSSYLPPTTPKLTTTSRPTTTTRPTTTPRPITTPRPVITTKLSTPGSKYIIPTIGSTTRIPTTFQTLRPIPPYTGTYPTYKFSTYNYTFTGTYPTTPFSFRPLVTVPTTPRPIGYVYTQPANDFEEIRRQ